jgi:hypothetical protein
VTVRSSQLSKIHRDGGVSFGIRDAKGKIVMVLEYQLDSLEGMDEGLADLYVQDGEKFVLGVIGLPESEATTAAPEPVELKNTLTKVRIEKRELEKELKKFRNVDLDKYEQAATELQSIKDAELQKQEQEAEELARKTGEWESQRQSLIDKNNERIQTLQSKYDAQSKDAEKALENATSSLQKYLLNSEITKSIIDAEGNVDILDPHVRRHLSVQNDNGSDYVVRVVSPTDGSVRLGEDGNPMSVTALINEFKENPAFQGDGIFKKQVKSGGSDSTGNKTPQSTTHNPFKAETINYTEQALLNKKDPALAAKLKLEANAH